MNLQNKTPLQQYMSIIREASTIYLSFICSFSVFSWTKRAFEKGSLMIKLPLV